MLSYLVVRRGDHILSSAIFLHCQVFKEDTCYKQSVVLTTNWQGEAYYYQWDILLWVHLDQSTFPSWLIILISKVL